MRLVAIKSDEFLRILLQNTVPFQELLYLSGDVVAKSGSSK